MPGSLWVTLWRPGGRSRGIESSAAQNAPSRPTVRAFQAIFTRPGPGAAESDARFDVGDWGLTRCAQCEFGAADTTRNAARSEDPYRYQFRLAYCRARLSPRDVARFLRTRRPAMTFMAAARTSAQRAAFDTVSIVPSTSMPWTTLPATITTARDM